MATANVQILGRPPLRSVGPSEITYCARGTPGVCYGVVAASNSDADVDAAIVAHIRQRKAAGKYYAGEPEPTAAERTITF